MFTKRPIDVAVALDKMRAVMNRNGDRALPLLLTEFSWPSAAGRILPQDAFGYEVTPAQQARRLTTVLQLLVARRRRLNLQQVFWYTWLTSDASHIDPFDYAGLRGLEPSGQIVQKPAQRAYRNSALTLEGCSKALVASACA
jgi:hypothetical protein